MKNSKLSGFTLAEVLITLAIIGVVAATVIPGIITNAQNKDMAVAERKARSTLSNAFMKAKMDNGGSLDGVKLGEELQNYIKVTENCNLTMSYKCWHPTGEAKILQSDGSYGNWGSSINWGLRTQDGMYIRLGRGALNCNQPDTNSGCHVRTATAGLCGALYIDINGAKNPNVFGKDIREVYFFADGYLRFPGDKGRSAYNWTRTKSSYYYTKESKEADSSTSCYDPNNYSTTIYNL